VAGAQPDVVARLKAFYEAWWAELEVIFKQVPAIYLGHEGENPVRLTSHDWIATEWTFWNQS
jgi:arylsulfatase B